MIQKPFDQREGYIWLDGQMLPWQDAKIHTLTHGLHYGSSVFEGIRVYNYKPFKLKQHLQRLILSAQTLGFSLPYSLEELTKSTLEVIKLNDIKNGYFRPAAWRGSETMLICGSTADASVLLAGWPEFENKRLELRNRGVRLTISTKWRKPDPDASPYTAKAASVYTLCTMVKNDATASGYDDALMLDSKGRITEATTANFFLIIGDELHTPTPDRFLNGITRQTVIEIAHTLGIKVIEKYLTPEDLKTAAGAFLTGTAIELMPVKSIDDITYDHQHPIFTKLCAAYEKLANS
ncbi:MAG: aminotransferase class IV [Rickettsiales bacterium]